MTFEKEPELQRAVHQDPGLILRGIPDIDPNFCHDSPRWVSQGREVALASGPVDMSFSEQSATRFDLVLMDFPGMQSSAARVIWRRHAELPQIPLVAHATRDTTAAIERMLALEGTCPGTRKLVLRS